MLRRFPEFPLSKPLAGKYYIKFAFIKAEIKGLENQKPIPTSVSGNKNTPEEKPTRQPQKHSRRDYVKAGIAAISAFGITLFASSLIMPQGSSNPTPDNEPVAVVMVTPTPTPTPSASYASIAQRDNRGPAGWPLITSFLTQGTEYANLPFEELPGAFETDVNAGFNLPLDSLDTLSQNLRESEWPLDPSVTANCPDVLAKAKKKSRMCAYQTGTSLVVITTSPATDFVRIFGTRPDALTPITRPNRITAFGSEANTTATPTPKPAKPSKIETVTPSPEPTLSPTTEPEPAENSPEPTMTSDATPDEGLTPSADATPSVPESESPESPLP